MRFDSPGSFGPAHFPAQTRTRTAAVIARELETANSIAASSRAIVAEAETAWPDPTPQQARMLAVSGSIADRYAARAVNLQAELEDAVSADLDRITRES